MHYYSVISIYAYLLHYMKKIFPAHVVKSIFRSTKPMYIRLFIFNIFSIISQKKMIGSVDFLFLLNPNWSYVQFLFYFFYYTYCSIFSKMSGLFLFAIVIITHLTFYISLFFLMNFYWQSSGDLNGWAMRTILPSEFIISTIISSLSSEKCMH